MSSINVLLKIILVLSISLNTVKAQAGPCYDYTTQCFIPLVAAEVLIANLIAGCTAAGAASGGVAAVACLAGIKALAAAGAGTTVIIGGASVLASGTIIAAAKLILHCMDLSIQCGAQIPIDWTQPSGTPYPTGGGVCSRSVGTTALCGSNGAPNTNNQIQQNCAFAYGPANVTCRLGDYTCSSNRQACVAECIIKTQVLAASSCNPSMQNIPSAP